MGLGAFELLNAPSASLRLQSFQCPDPTWIQGASANAALAAQIGTFTVLIVDDSLTVYNQTSSEPLLKADANNGAQEYSFDSTEGMFQIRRIEGDSGNERWGMP